MFQRSAVHTVQAVLAFCVTFLPAVGTQAQGASGRLTGHWLATFDSDLRVERDTFIVRKRARASLDLVQRGDSVSGVWRDGTDDSTEVRGTFDGRLLTFTSGSEERTIRINDKPATMKVRRDFTGVVTGDNVAGTLLIYMGDRPPPPRKWEASRARR